MGTIIRSHDSKDIEMLLLENGWATVKEELADSMLTIRHNELQKKAKDKLKGLFNKGVGIKRFEDLTSLAAHKDPLHLYRRL